MRGKIAAALKYSFVCTLIFSCLSVSLSASENKITLEIAQLDWCPAICPGKEKKGHVVDLLDAVFLDSPYDLVFTTYPWSRTLSKGRSGAAFAIIAPTRKEAPSLIFPQQPVGIQNSCFFTLSTSEWRYDGVQSLDGLRIGLAADSSLEEINSYVLKNREKFYFQSVTERYIPLSINMLFVGRLDVFGFTENEVLHYLKEEKLQNSVRQAGCVSPTPVYIAFSPIPEASALRDRVMAFFDTKVQEMRLNGKVTEIMARYDAPDWSTYQK